MLNTHGPELLLHCWISFYYRSLTTSLSFWTPPHPPAGSAEKSTKKNPSARNKVAIYTDVLCCRHETQRVSHVFWGDRHSCRNINVLFQFFWGGTGGWNGTHVSLTYQRRSGPNTYVGFTSLTAAYALLLTTTPATSTHLKVYKCVNRRSTCTNTASNMTPWQSHQRNV